MPTPEALARAKIDELPAAAGWIMQDYKALNLGAVREIPLESGRYDYLAKRVRTTARQAGISAGDLKGLPIPPLAEQTRIVAEVERLLSVAKELETHV